MTTTWVVVAHRTGARILATRGPKAGLELVHEMQNPKGRLKNVDLETDRPGRVSESSNPGPRVVARHETAHDHVAHTFAKEIAAALDAARMEGRYERLVVCAEPRFLGMLTEVLGHELTKMVSATINKDLAHVEVRDLGAHLEDAV